MNVVALVTQKGGAGKSTLASNLAVSAFLGGERVFICDLDPLQSLVKWSKSRKALDIPVEHIPAGKLERALVSLERDGVSLVVATAGVTAALVHRIRVEEPALAATFGSAWAAHCERTWRLVPFVW